MGALRWGLAGIALISTVGCAEPEEQEEPLSSEAEALQSTALADRDMKRIPTPSGMPTPWTQPDSTGWLEERGKCGPTAVANALRLYGIETSPAEVDRDGVHWYVGTRGINVESYFEDKHPELGCALHHPEDGAQFIRSNLAAGHPVLVWYNTEGFLQSHWVTVVGRRGQGPNEVAIVMSWGHYYTIPMAKLDEASRNVYLVRHPTVVCSAKTTKLVR